MATEQFETDTGDEHQRRRIGRILSWLLLPGTALLGLGAIWSVSVGPQPVQKLFIDHFRAVVGLPGAAVAALFINMLLEQTHGQIEFEGLGFKFRGASGPVVLWVLCYLAIVASIRLVW
jgi:hypothetical protein